MASLQDQELRERRAAVRRRQRRRRRAVLAALVIVAALVGVVIATAAGGGDGRPGRGLVGESVAGQPSRAARAANGGGDGGATHTPVAAIRVRLGAIPAAASGTARVYTRGPARGRMVALTFDDGFCPACVARIVDVLLRTGAHATFFPNGQYARSWDPQAAKIRTLVERGQLIVGNHTFHHVDAPVVGAAAFGADLEQNEQWIERTFGLTGRPFVRPPYGAYDGGTLAAAGPRGYTRVIMWSGTVADSSLRTIPYILHAIRYWAKPGAIILMHGNYPPTARALPQILALLRRMRLRPVTIEELLGGSSYRAAP
ncbi:MAG TPA: polysaccharide deacetylase family protein [Conexibacter sp.]|jgi:peptidoglycan/xylan/chitin deacetylase (PgdA/CDA1 family)|nr:polysaccharide deacetylase family protein [Conexibacter sp.]